MGAEKKSEELLAFLEELLEECQGQYDTVDGKDGTPYPNFAMRLGTQIEGFLGRAP